MRGPAETSETDSHALINPILIVEIRSDSTAEFDWIRLKSQEYVLVSQSKLMVDTFFPTEDGTWEIRTLS